MPCLIRGKGYFKIEKFTCNCIKECVFDLFFSAGGIKKSKKPVSALTIENNKKARLALATGEVSKDEQNRRADRDLRTLYIRFKSSDSAPKTNQDVFALEKRFVLHNPASFYL